MDKSNSEYVQRRLKAASCLIPAGSHVFELGLSDTNLKDQLPFGCQHSYFNLANNNVLPDISQNYNLIAGLDCWEYLDDLPQAIARLTAYKKDLLISYQFADGMSDESRIKLGWHNHLKKMDLLKLFQHNGLYLQKELKISNHESLFLVSSKPLLKQRPKKKVLVVSYNNIGNFGDRLGAHCLTKILPSNAFVEYATFKPFSANLKVKYDLVIIGIGNSIFEPILTDELITLVRHAKKSIGIFGTQYREKISQKNIKELFKYLDFWFARYKEDVLIYGDYANQVEHLGDWLISEFPMVNASEEGVLKVGDEILKNLPLDRTIQQINKYKQVFSTRLHPLICAMTSADQIGYLEQPDVDGLLAGKFRSMLLDVYGYHYPQNQMFQNDKLAVANYRGLVLRKMKLLENKIDEYLR
ncbi:MAG: hypothetical protein EP298_03195 [Gammaproteobacteria bacterium]|nr:MAG: hypothetical protein EP298_03195 [Gammaproteobacteria bacterium]UTW43568.1 hypothetical protein KFE69_05620 [bacterium SCSIO 12844]